MELEARAVVGLPIADDGLPTVGLAKFAVGWGLLKRGKVRVRVEGMWEFPKIGVTLFWGPFNKDPTN